jgi:hypothetical protein
MAWSASKIFLASLEDALENTTALDLNSDTFKAALYDNDITPDQTVASANTAYNAGQWAISGNEVSNGGWAAGGVALTSVTSSFTLASVFGCLVYDDTLTTPVADQGVCYNYFGGTQSVTAGTFTIQWSASGIFSLTL